MTSTEGFALTVEVPADEWAFTHRRLIYLEGVLFNLVRRHGVREHFSAADLAALRLPGLPCSAAGITRRATNGRWPRQRGANGFTYHVSCLPPAAFDALVARLLDVPDMEGVHFPMEAFKPPRVESPRPLPDNAAPAWVLPLMRLVKGKAQGDLAAAWEALPDNLPDGVDVPTLKEAATVLVRFGLA